MAHESDDMDAFAGIFREGYRLERRITSSRMNPVGTDLAGDVGLIGLGGAQLIREQVEAEEPLARTLDNFATAAGESVEVLSHAPSTTDLGDAASEMHRLVDVPEDWPQWSLARRAAKRGLDIVLTIVALAVLLPFLALVAVAIRLESPGPALYRQKRCGRDGRCFDMLKFRSMVRDADRLLVDLRDRNQSDGLLFKVKDDPRVTRVGRFIRRYSIDELPQLLNVLSGQMSLVGPRPLPVDPEAFGPIDGKRHAVRPGLTCHWQVSGRSTLSYGQMVEMDLAYIRESSIWTDIRLIIMTVPVAFGGCGAF